MRFHKIWSLFILLIFPLFGVSQVAYATAYPPTTSGSRTITMTDDLPAGSTGVDPNRSVTVNYSVSPATCPSGNMYHVLKHMIGGGPSYEYRYLGTGGSFSSQYNSGNDQQKNVYAPYFFCFGATPSSDNASMDSLLGMLNASGVVWVGTAYNISTRVNPNPTSNNPGAGTSNNPSASTTNNPTASTSNNSDPNQVVATFDNPLAGTADTLPQLFMRLMKIFLSMIGGLSVFMIIIGGFQLVMSQGDSEAAEKGKKTITYAVMGVVLALLSFVMIIIVQNLLGAPVVDPATIMNRK